MWVTLPNSHLQAFSRVCGESHKDNGFVRGKNIPRKFFIYGYFDLVSHKENSTNKKKQHENISYFVI